MFIRSVVPSKTIPDSSPKWAKLLPFFQTKTAQNPTLWGGTHRYGLHKGVPTGLVQKSENYAAFEHGFPLVAFKFYAAKRQSFR